MVRLIALACISPLPYSAESPDSKIHEVDTAALSTTGKGGEEVEEKKKKCACDARVFLFSVRSRFPSQLSLTHCSSAEAQGLQ